MKCLVTVDPRDVKPGDMFFDSEHIGHVRNDRVTLQFVVFVDLSDVAFGSTVITSIWCGSLVTESYPDYMRLLKVEP